MATGAKRQTQLKLKQVLAFAVNCGEYRVHADGAGEDTPRYDKIAVNSAVEENSFARCGASAQQRQKSLISVNDVSEMHMSSEKTACAALSAAQWCHVTARR